MTTFEGHTRRASAVALFEAGRAGADAFTTRSEQFARWRHHRLSVPRSAVAWGATGYLVAPVLLFLVGYLHAPLTIACGLVLVGVLVRTARRRTNGRGGAVALSRQGVIALAATALAVSLSTGALGGFRLMGDWYKHNSMLFDLSTNPWPVHFDYLGDSSLIYSFAFYLPAAALSHLAGGSVVAAHIALVLWMAVGFFAVLLCAAAVLPARKRVAGAVGAMLTWGGAEALGIWITSGQTITTPNPWWAGGVQYSSAITAIRWVPQHAISGWLLGALYVLAWRAGTWRSILWLSIALLASALWSPFVFIGGAVLCGFLAVRLLVRQGFPPLKVLVPTALAVAACSPVLAFLALPAGGQRFERGALTPAQYALFVVVMVGLWVLAALLASPMRLALLPAVALLVVLPAFHLGMYNDLVMRTSIPALFVVCLLAWDGVLRSRRRGVARALAAGALGAAVLLGVPSNLTEMSYAVNASKGVPGTMEEPRQLDQTLAQYLAESGGGPGTLIWKQYITCSHGPLSTALGLPGAPACTRAR